MQWNILVPSIAAFYCVVAITLQDAARIQSATARANGGIVPAGSFAARAQAAAAKNVRDGIVPDGEL